MKIPYTQIGENPIHIYMKRIGATIPKSNNLEVFWFAVQHF